MSNILLHHKYSHIYTNTKYFHGHIQSNTLMYSLSFTPTAHSQMHSTTSTPNG